MLFIALLVLSALAVAGAAAFFSVYGLAATFSGTFWSVVIMGSSLEAAKLVASSYLYRYWYATNKMLKGYLLSGIFALMVMTSTGIYGYLASGYQTDVLPLRQMQEQVKVLEEEKTRKLERKKQIDNQIAQLPNESVRGRERLVKQFKEEQSQLTARANELDKELLELKTKQIKTEAHVGPITYIAKAFGLDADDATKYLIFLIIFAFDPMAISLTLAVNIALKERDKEQALKHEIQTDTTVFPRMATHTEPDDRPEDTGLSGDNGAGEHLRTDTGSDTLEEQQNGNNRTTDMSGDRVGIGVTDIETEMETITPTSSPAISAPVGETAPGHPTSSEHVLQHSEPEIQQFRPIRNGMIFDNTDEKIGELTSHYKMLSEKQRVKNLSLEEVQEKRRIEDIFRKMGYNLYT